MADIEKLKVGELAAVERAELDAALAGGPAYLADNDDIVALWLFTGMAGIGGIVAGFIGGVPVMYAREAMMLAGAALLVWTALTAATQFRKRGCVFTSAGTYKRVGSKLKGMRHANVKALKFYGAGRRHKFTVLELHGNDGSSQTLYCHRGWGEQAVAAIQKARGGNIPVTDR
jgi:hypothetical protein